MFEVIRTLITIIEQYWIWLLAIFVLIEVILYLIIRRRRKIYSLFSDVQQTAYFGQTSQNLNQGLNQGIITTGNIVNQSSNIYYPVQFLPRFCRRRRRRRGRRFF